MVSRSSTRVRIFPRQTIFQSQSKSRTPKEDSTAPSTKHFLYQSHENAFAFHHPLARRDALDGEKSKSLCVTCAGGRANHTLKNAFLLAWRLCFLFFSVSKQNCENHLPFFSRGRKKSVSLFRREKKRSINFLFFSAFPLIWACNIVLRFFHRDSDGGESRNVFLSCARTEDEKLRCCGSDKGCESRAKWAWHWVGRSEGALMCSI